MSPIRYSTFDPTNTPAVALFDAPKNGPTLAQNSFEHYEMELDTGSQTDTSFYDSYSDDDGSNAGDNL